MNFTVSIYKLVSTSLTWERGGGQKLLGKRKKSTEHSNLVNEVQQLRRHHCEELNYSRAGGREEMKRKIEEAEFN